MQRLCASCYYVSFCAFLSSWVWYSCIYLCETETLDTHSQKNVGSRTHAEILEISIIHLKYTYKWTKSRNMSHISKYTLCSTRNWTNCRCDTCISLRINAFYNIENEILFGFFLKSFWNETPNISFCSHISYSHWESS